MNGNFSNNIDPALAAVWLTKASPIDFYAALAMQNATSTIPSTITNQQHGHNSMFNSDRTNNFLLNHLHSLTNTNNNALNINGNSNNNNNNNANNQLNAARNLNLVELAAAAQVAASLQQQQQLNQQ
jgi:hypothetical protein